jgi:LysM repeat protein
MGTKDDNQGLGTFSTSTQAAKPITVKATSGATLSGIAKANGTTVAQILTDNPTLAARAAAGTTVLFNNTSVKITAPATATNPYGANSAGQGAGLGTASVPISTVKQVLTTPASTTTLYNPLSGIVTDSQNAARLEAEAKARAEAEAAAKAEADRLAAIALAEAKAKAEAERLAAEEAIRNAKNAAELAAAQAALAAALAAANANSGVSGTYSNTGNINTSTTQAAPTTTQTAALVAGATTLSAADKARLDALEVMKARFKQYGLETLVEKIRQLAIEGASESTITLQLQETPEYQARFKANTVRLKNNLAVLSPAEYLAVEDSYRQTLRAYGLKQFDTDEYVSQFIANDVSPTELSNRVQLAVQRVQNADPAISKTLRDYYGIGQADLVAYTLDPATQFKKIERQVQAAEIGTAARLQGLETGVGVAEQLAAQGVTQAEAQKGYATIADILPTAEKLSAIYGSTLEGYGQSQAEQEVFNTLASAQRARQKLTAREVAQFSGSSGLNKTALSTGSGQI